MTVATPVVEILDSVVVEILRRKTPADRLAQAFRMWNTARLVTSSSIRQQHPDWSDQMVQQATASRLSHGMSDHVPP